MADNNTELLNNKISEYLTEIISLKGKISTLEDEKTKLSKSLSSEKALTKRLKAKVGELEKEIEGLHAEIAALNEEGKKK